MVDAILDSNNEELCEIAGGIFEENMGTWGKSIVSGTRGNNAGRWNGIWGGEWQGGLGEGGRVIGALVAIVLT
jgi:hypothetical protein